jgi:hypothetical protein
VHGRWVRFIGCDDDKFSHFKLPFVSRIELYAFEVESIVLSEWNKKCYLSENIIANDLLCEWQWVHWVYRVCDGFLCSSKELKGIIP